ncbi:MAG: restriction endonuclease [Pseudomonadota bacterium]|nr:restriction endonuclease [Pseudomonadota bacterium]
MWKVTAGRSNIYVAEFLESGLVAIGWSEAGDYRAASTRADLIAHFAGVWPEQTSRQIQVGAGQVWRFLHEIQVGDKILTYDPATRLYHVGVVGGGARYEPERMERLPVARAVEWQASVSRDALSDGTKNTLGAIMTIFKLSTSAEAEILQLAGQPLPETGAANGSEDAAIVVDPYADIADQALERVKDRILSLGWDELQELVAALLRTLGYRTVVSPAGPDRGRDILASRDGFGFEPPRIVVEVKHRRGAMGAPEVRAFLGGRHSDDRGLYVSTGGFTREAQYEAERASTVTHLMNLDDLARSLIDQYDAMDARGRALLPLTRLYWPL